VDFKNNQNTNKVILETRLQKRKRNKTEMSKMGENEKLKRRVPYKEQRRVCGVWDRKGVTSQLSGIKEASLENKS